jgi:hypothetical protein
MIELFSNFYLMNKKDISNIDDLVKPTYILKLHVKRATEEDISKIINKWINFTSIVVEYDNKDEITEFLKTFFMNLVSRSTKNVKELLMYNHCVFFD